MDLKNRILNTEISLCINSKVHPAFHIAVHTLALLQLTAVIIHQESSLYKLIFWADPTNWIGVEFSTGVAASITFLAVTILLALIYSRNSNDFQMNTESCRDYLESIFIYLQTTCESIILVPLIRSTLLQLTQPSSQGFLALGIITSVVFLSAVFTTALFLASDTSVLTGQIDRKLALFTPPLLLVIFRLLFAVASVLSPFAILSLAAIWVCLYAFSTIQTPTACFQLERFSRAMTSTVTFACLLRLLNTVFDAPEGFLSAELLGSVCFLPLINELSMFRIKMIMRQKSSIYQTKILIYMVENLSDMRTVLDSYVLQHFKGCNKIQCLCRRVIQHLTSKTTDLQDEKIWYEFIVSHIQSCYKLEIISQLPKSQMEMETEQYTNLVFDLAQIRILKLQQLYKAHTTLVNFSRHLEKHDLMKLWSQRRSKTVFCCLQKAISERCRLPGTINVHANTYADFQETVEKYFQLLLGTADQTLKFWQELGHYQPSETYLRQISQQIESQNHSITTLYDSIISRYPESTDVLEKMTEDYFHKVLNVFPGDPFHAIVRSEGESPPKRKNKKLERLSEDMDAFAQNSETPIFLISVEPTSLGKILKGNRYFEQAMNSCIGSVISSQDLMIPQMRSWHLRLIKQSLQEDRLIYEHREGFLMTSKRKLLSAKILIQVAPSVAEGLRYVVFLKRLLPRKRIVAIRNYSQIVYISDSFERLIDTSFSRYEFQRAFKTKPQEDLQNFQPFSLQIQAEKVSLTLINKFKAESSNLHFYSVSLIDELLDHKETVQMLPVQSIAEKRNSLSHPRQNTFLLKENRLDEGQFPQESEIPETTLKQKNKSSKEIKQMFKVIMSEKKGVRVGKCICVIPMIVGLSIITLLAACIVVKENNKETFSKAIDNNNNYYQMMNRIAQTAINLKMLNLKSYQGQNNSRYLKAVVQAPSIKKAMDNYLSYFNVSEIDREWKTLKLQADRSFMEGSESYFKAIPDYLQTPLVNLQDNKLSFNFTFALDYVVPPVTSTEQYFHTYLINSLYFAIPKLRAMKRSVIDPIVKRKMQKETLVSAFCVLIIVIIITGNLFISIVYIKLTKLKHFTHRFIEKISPETIKAKIRDCQQFVKEYALTVEKNETTEKTATTPAIKAINESQMVFSGEDKTIRLVKEKEIERDFEFACEEQQWSENEKKPSDLVATDCENYRKRKNEQLFSLNSYIWIVLKRMMMILPIVTFGIILLIMEKKEKGNLQNLMMGVDGIEFTILDLRLIHLYGLQLGVYSFSLEQYQSMIKQAMGIIFEMFYVINLLLTQMAEIKTEFFQKLTYGNLCELDQTGFYSTASHSFPGRYNQTFCESIDHGILTRGFNAGLVSYVEEANTLFLNNVMAGLYPPQLKLNFLNHYFFTDTVQVVDYLIVALETSSFISSEQLNQGINLFTSILMYGSICTITVIVVFLTIFRKHMSAKLTSDITEVSSLFTLISYRTVIQNQDLKKSFLDNIDNIKFIK